jgi:SAM-dependent methyltransferase
MSDKTTYTELWEKDSIEVLYRKFSAVVKPFELPLLNLVIKKTDEIFEGRNDLSMFEIGAGTGKYTASILNGITQNHHLTYTGIDVSSAQHKQFEENSKAFPETVEVSEYTLASWQEYPVTRKYDLVVAQHSWYGIGGSLDSFEKLKAITAEGGVCFLMLNSKDNISHIAMENNGEPLFSSEDAEVSLRALGIPYEKVRSFNEDSPREKFLQNGRLTQHGIDHFSYLYRKALLGDEQNVIDMVQSAPDEAFRFPTDLIIVRP